MKKINHRLIVLAGVMLLLTFRFAATAYAHGVVITYALKANGEVELLAEFDTGEPMAEAQVTVYSPADPLTPWLTGTADAEGHYTFVIDPDMPGSWDIQCRTAGHGDIIHLQLETGLIDPALMAQPPGELLPPAPAAETTIAEAGTASITPAENEATAVEAKPEVAESEASPAAETATHNPAHNMDMSAQETGAEVAESSAAAETTAVEEKSEEEIPAKEMETETAPVTGAETVVEPEPVAQAEAVPQVSPAETETETETVAQVAPKPAGQVAVLSSGGNAGSTGGFTSFQILLMSASVIWGFVGTALYFSGQKTQDHGHTHGHHHEQ